LKTSAAFSHVGLNRNKISGAILRAASELERWAVPEFFYGITPAVCAPPPAILIGAPAYPGFTKSRISPIFFSRPTSPHAEIFYRTDTV
jgi:hypothetical protein